MNIIVFMHYLVYYTHPINEIELNYFPGKQAEDISKFLKSFSGTINIYVLFI